MKNKFLLIMLILMVGVMGVFESNAAVQKLEIETFDDYKDAIKYYYMNDVELYYSGVTSSQVCTAIEIATTQLVENNEGNEDIIQEAYDYLNNLYDEYPFETYFDADLIVKINSELLPLLDASANSSISYGGSVAQTGASFDLPDLSIDDVSNETALAEEVSSNNAGELSEETLDYIPWSLVNEGYCPGCNRKVGGATSKVSDIVIAGNSFYADGGSYGCDDCQTLVKYYYAESLKNIYDTPSIEISPRVSHSCKASPPPLDKITIQLEDYGFVKHKNLGIYIHEELLETINVNEKNRVFISESAPGDYRLVEFSPEVLDIYQEGVYNDLVSEKYQTLKYGIAPLYDFIPSGMTLGVGRLIPNSANDLRKWEDKIFFVGSECSGCKGGCSNYVASNGSTLGATPNDLILSKGCAQSHACGFLWLIDNGGNSHGKLVQSHEEIDCIETKGAGQPFCRKHTCAICFNAIIGVNLADARMDMPSVYDGSDESMYSVCCVDHFCWYYKCKLNCLGTDSVEPNDGDNGFLEGFENYCMDHDVLCGVAGCPNRVKRSAYETAGYKKICSECQGKELEKLRTCYVCSKTCLPSYVREINGHNICLKCVGERKSGSQKNSNKWREVLGVSVEDWNNLSAEEKLNESKEILDNIIPETIKDPESETGLKSDVDFEGNVTHEFAGDCSRCGNSTFIKVFDGDGNIKIVCINCYENQKPTESDGNNNSDNNSNTDSGTTSGTETGSGSGNYPFYDGGSGSSGNDSSDCDHTKGRPDEDDIKYIDNSDFNHTEIWTCTKCKKEQRVVLNHKYVNKVCACGHKQDEEKPAIEFLIPANAEPNKVMDVEAGSEIRIKVTDNVALQSIEYIGLFNNNIHIEKTEVLGNAKVRELLLGTFPAELGNYNLTIFLLADANGNKLERITYKFNIVEKGTVNDPDDENNTSNPGTEDGKDNDGNNDSENEGDEDKKPEDVVITEDTELPKVELISHKSHELVKGTKVYFKFSDDKGLKRMNCEVREDDKDPKVKAHDFGGVLEQKLGILELTAKKTVIKFTITDINENVLEASYTFELYDDSFIIIDTDNKKDDQYIGGLMPSPAPEIIVITPDNCKSTIREDDANLSFKVNLALGNKVALLMNSIQELDKIVYDCLWDKEGKLENELSGYEDVLVLEFVDKGDYVLYIHELVDNEGNILKDITLTFEAGEWEVTTGDGTGDGSIDGINAFDYGLFIDDSMVDENNSFIYLDTDIPNPVE